MHVHFLNIPDTSKTSNGTLEVLVFKTGIANSIALKRAAFVLNQLRGIARWNIDMQDDDHVLRIETSAITAEEIITTIKYAGYRCEELTD